MGQQLIEGVSSITSSVSMLHIGHYTEEPRQYEFWRELRALCDVMGQQLIEGARSITSCVSMLHTDRYTVEPCKYDHPWVLKCCPINGEASNHDTNTKPNDSEHN